MGTGGRAQVRLRDDDHMQWLRELPMEPVHRVPRGLDVSLSRGLCEVLHRELGVIDLAALLASGTPPGIRAARGEVQGGITPQLGHAM